MKKSIKILLKAALFLCAAIITSCASTDVEEEKVISSVSADHFTVKQCDSKIIVSLNKTKDEDISAIQIMDKVDESQVTVPMTSEKIDFVWPFSENGKEYELSANVIDSKGNVSSQESVSFKVEGNPAAINYSDDFLNSTLVLIAADNQRIVRFNSTQDALKKVTEPLSTKASELMINIYSGSHYKADVSNATLVATLTKSIDNKTDIEEVFNGYDLISNASVFNLTADEMNKALSANQTYFAIATIKFPAEGLDNVSFTSKTLYSHDTIYTPISSDKDKIEDTNKTETSEIKYEK